MAQGALLSTGFNTPVLRTSKYVFANLPTSPAEGSIAYVIDSTTNVWGATITGGGSIQVLAWWNGSEWTVFGK